ncbi:MAG: DinB family protein, partial [Actinobacteria bacterium]|nr:DinB family protein [Actinomycetota bacterium]
MPITPDTKDWTWVLDKPCPECGFEAAAFPREEVGPMLRGNAALWPELLGHPKAKVRPSDDRWSALEYACHVRDVFRLYDERLVMMLERDAPDYPNWDQDVAAVEGRYPEQEPPDVARHILEDGERLAARFDSLKEPEWQRTGNR